MIKVCKAAVPNVVEPAVGVLIRKAWLYYKNSVRDSKAEEKKEFDPIECTTLDALGLSVNMYIKSRSFGYRWGVSKYTGVWS